MILTYQDFQAAGDKVKYVREAIDKHKQSELYLTAVDADAYDRQKNTTIMDFVKTIMSGTGSRIIDITAANNKIASNFFRRLNTQRNMYSLGNGVTFEQENLKEKLGDKFDTRLQQAGYKALIHGVSFVFWNLDMLYVFPVTEFVPLWDEETGALRAGVRFWQVDTEKPLMAVLYEEDGYTKYKSVKDATFTEVEPKRAYKQTIRKSQVDGEEIVSSENYSTIPIIPLWGSSLRQSTLVGMRQSIDSYDLIRSGFANDLSDCAQIYWIIKNAGGMSEKDLTQFRERLLLRHIATVDNDMGVDITAHTPEIPFQARCQYLDRIRGGIYEDFGALDVYSISATAKTATEIDAAYQPLDETADDYEYQVIECVQQILALQGIEDTPVFKRNRVSNQFEQVQMIILEAPYLDDETILNKLPNVTPDEVKAILEKKAADELDRFKKTQEDDETGTEPVTEPTDGAGGDE